jgi:hypothetical protein
MPSASKKLRGSRKTLELEGIATWVNDEECSLFTDLTLEANSGRNQEFAIFLLEVSGH